MTLKRFSTAWMITIVCAALALTGCGGTDAPDAGTDAGTEVPAAETERGTDVSVDAKDGDGTELPAETAPETAAPATGSVTEPETQPDTGETGSVTLYQLAPDANSLTMGYVIRTEHNKLIVIDGGGYDGVSLKDTPSYLPAALRAIAGAGEDGYFEVEAWFLTHAHVDHIYELSKLLRDYSGSSGFAIRNIYFDFPDFDEGTYAGYGDDFRLSGLRDNLNAYGTVIGAEAGDGLDYYDTVNASVINEAAIRDGLSFDIDGVRIDVLQTWSEKDGVSNFNDTSLVMRVTAGGQSILFLGDAGVNAGKRLVNTYGDGLKSDIVQMAHHGQGGVNGLCYAAIDAQGQLWPTPVWVWKNESGKYQIDNTRAWLYGETFLEPDAYNLVAGMYASYPRRADRVSEWVKVLDGMSIELPYVLPRRPGMNGEQADGFVPVGVPYVQDGLVHVYSGTTNTRGGHDDDSAVWEDLTGGYDVTLTGGDKTCFTDDGLSVNCHSVYFPVKVMRVLNGREFTVELLMGGFKSVGTTFNAVFCSSNEHINLFRRNAGDILELKFYGDNNQRIRIPNGLAVLQDSLITITYRQGEFIRVYVNGVLMGEAPAADMSLDVTDLFIGYPQPAASAEGVYRAVRFYNRALTGEECAANAVIDGVRQ